MSIKRLLQFLSWPIAVGVIAAAALLLVFPDLLQPGSLNGSQADRQQRLNPLQGWQGRASYADAVNRAAPSVVNIYTRKQVQRRRHPLLDDPQFKQFFNSASRTQSRPQFGLGSGVILNEQGFILTNLHVVEGAEQIEVQLQDGRQASAQIVGSDPDTDLTVLKIELDNLTPINIGDSRRAAVGDVVLAIGNPYGFSQTVTQGIISATRRSGLNTNRYESYLQTDAAINPGSSGGALIDAFGNLLGINTLILDNNASAGISFAIPADMAVKVLKDIVQHGRVIRGWLGIETARELSAAHARQMGLATLGGLLVESIYINSPAQQSGLKPGDLITHINKNRVVDTEYGRSLVANVMPGDAIELEVVRRGNTLTLNAIAGIAPSPQGRG